MSRVRRMSSMIKQGRPSRSAGAIILTVASAGMNRNVAPTYIMIVMTAAEHFKHHAGVLLSLRANAWIMGYAAPTVAYRTADVLSGRSTKHSTAHTAVALRVEVIPHSLKRMRVSAEQTAQAVMSSMLVRVPRYIKVKLSAAMREAKVSVNVFFLISAHQQPAPQQSQQVSRMMSVVQILQQSGSPVPVLFLYEPPNVPDW